MPQVFQRYPHSLCQNLKDTFKARKVVSLKVANSQKRVYLKSWKLGVNWGREKISKSQRYHSQSPIQNSDKKFIRITSKIVSISSYSQKVQIKDAQHWLRQQTLKKQFIQEHDKVIKTIKTSSRALHICLQKKNQKSQRNDFWRDSGRR